METNIEPRSKAITYIYLIIIVLAVLAGIWYFGFSKATKTVNQSVDNTTVSSSPPANTSTESSAATSSASSSKITDDSGLVSANSELDSTNLNDLDSALTQNDSDIADF